jgi:hypothetical protein
MARGIFKGNPSPEVKRERAQLIARTQMDAREQFEVRTEERRREIFEQSVALGQQSPVSRVPR